MHLRDKFPQDISDIAWIEKLAMEGEWVVLTCDYDIARRGAIKVAWKNAGLVGFVLRSAWQDFSPMDQAWRLIKLWPVIVEQSEAAAPGSTYELGTRGGRIPPL